AGTATNTGATGPAGPPGASTPTGPTGSTGYFRIGNFFFQWGNDIGSAAQPSGTGISVVFPTAFPNACDNVQVTMATYNYGTDDGLGVTGLSATGFQWFFGAGSNYLGVYWFA